MSRNLLASLQFAGVALAASALCGCSSDPYQSMASTEGEGVVASSRPVVQDFSLPAVNGDGAFKLSDARGEWVALHFLLKTDCPICMGLTREYTTRADEAPGVRQVFIKPDESADTLRWLKTYPDSAGEAPNVYRDADAALADRLGIPDGYFFHGETVHYPAVVLIDPQGREAFRYVGTRTQDRLKFDDFLAQLKTLRGS